MKSKSKLTQIMLFPIRILNKAKDFYVKGVLDCSSKVNYRSNLGGPGLNFVTLTKSSSVNYSKTSDDDEQFLRSWSRRRGEMDKNICGSSKRSNCMRRSYSVGVGVIGRIDEEKACSFRKEEDDDGNEVDFYYESRSHALRRHVVY